MLLRFPTLRDSSYLPINNSSYPYTGYVFIVTLPPTFFILFCEAPTRGKGEFLMTMIHLTLVNKRLVRGVAHFSVFGTLNLTLRRDVTSNLTYTLTFDLFKIPALTFDVHVWRNFFWIFHFLRQRHLAIRQIAVSCRREISRKILFSLGLLVTLC